MFYIVLLTITLIVTSDLHTLRNGPNGVTPAFPEHEEDGPFCMLYTNFFREIIKKSDLALKDIFGATDLAIQKMNREGHFVWLGDSQNMVQELLINEFEEISAEELKAQAKILSDRMRNRTQYYDAEINYVFDYLNNFFTKNDTARGSEALSKFRAYPQEKIVTLPRRQFYKEWLKYPKPEKNAGLFKYISARFNLKEATKCSLKNIKSTIARISTHCRRFREYNTRRCSRVATNYDMLSMLLITSDPLINQSDVRAQTSTLKNINIISEKPVDPRNQQFAKLIVFEMHRVSEEKRTMTYSKILDFIRKVRERKTVYVM